MNDILTHPFILPMLVPFAAGLLCLLIPSRFGMISGALAVITSLAEAGLIWPLFRMKPVGYEIGSWLHFRIDPLSGFALLAVALFGLVTAIYSIGYMKGKGRLSEYYAYILWTLGACVGALLANDFLVLLVFWGFLGLTLYLLIGIGGSDASAAAKKSFIIIGGSDCFLILGIVLLWQISGSIRMDGQPVDLIGIRTYVAFICFAIAAFAKSGAMPFHSWVPDCGEKAPASVSAFLPASLDKLLGIYLLFRMTSSIFTLTPSMNTLLMIVGAGTIICAVMMALVQHDIRRLLSYHAVSQVGYMVLGIGTGNVIGMAGGLFHMLNHTLYKSCLFFTAGSVEKQTGTMDVDSLGGLAKTMPFTFFACFIASLSIAGIPPLNGFASKWMIYQGIIESGRSGGVMWIFYLAAAMLGSALTLASFVKVLHAVYLKKASPLIAEKKPVETGISMWMPSVFLASICIVFGVAAYHLPLKYLIYPCINGHVALIGTWWAGPATVLLIVSFAIGLLLYLITTVSKARIASTYIGGEDMSKVYVTNTPLGSTRDVEVTGADFYKTIQEIGFFKSMYAMAEKKWFDIYDVLTNVIFYAVDMLRRAHSGVLPRYLTWFLAGLLLIILILVGKAIG
jgi:formate hydrogenlyase subunit 3/multisubunit Na+/H+ antiporter MnhD subunit